ncbi:hypothetical protein ACWGIA_11115 [Streptomyces bobili]
MPARRPRISARIVKRGISRYHTWNRDGRPLASTPITALALSVRPPALAPPRTRAPGKPDRWTQISQIMTTAAYRTWQAKDVLGRRGLQGIRGPQPATNNDDDWGPPASPTP